MQVNKKNNFDYIKLEGFEKMGADLGIDIMSDLFLVYFLFKCKARKNDCLTKKEFENGLNAMGLNKFTDLCGRYFSSFLIFFSFI